MNRLKPSLRKLFKGKYIKCACGCGALVHVAYKKSRGFRKYLPLHRLKGSSSPKWKGGRRRTGRYWNLRCVEHHRPINDSILEHVYFYEQYHKCCLLKWGIVHHIDHNKENNMVWNLEGMMDEDHRRLHAKGNRNTRGKHKDTSDRRCFNCGSKTTYMKKLDRKHKTIYPVWHHLHHDKINWYCGICFDKIRRVNFKS